MYAPFQAFANCAFGVSMVGYVLVTEGVGFTVASMLCGPLTSFIPRAIQMLTSFVVFIFMGIQN